MKQVLDIQKKVLALPCEVAKAFPAHTAEEKKCTALILEASEELLNTFKIMQKFVEGVNK